MSSETLFKLDFTGDETVTWIRISSKISARFRHRAKPHQGGRLVYRQSVATRLTHWLWALCLFFLAGSGLQIFNAHPELSFGEQSGAATGQVFLTIEAKDTPKGPVGITNFLGLEMDSSGLLGLQGEGLFQTYQAFPSFMTLPSGRDLTTGRAVHFFFAWLFVATLLIWLIASLRKGRKGHIIQDLWMTKTDWQALPADFMAHVKGQFHHTRRYQSLQKLTYGSVLFFLFPLMIATGLAMSPGMNAILPWLTELFGGRQSARSFHFIGLVLLFGFFLIHMAMILLAGPINELRAIITGWYRTDPPISPSPKLDDEASQ